MPDAAADELVGVDPEGNVSSCERTRERTRSRLASIGTSRQALLGLVVDGAKELDGPQHADADERVAERPPKRGSMASAISTSMRSTCPRR
jgi:hypothetical protein